MVHVSEANLPRCMPESWTVRGLKGEPSTLEVDIMDGSISRANLPRYMPESWKVHILSTNLPTKHLEQTKSAMAASAAARRNAKRRPEAMVRPKRAPP